MLYKSMLVALLVLIGYNYINSFLLTKNAQKSDGVIVSKIDTKQGSWQFAYKYFDGKKEIVDTTDHGEITELTYDLGERVEVLCQGEKSVLNNFQDLYLPNTILLLVIVAFHFVRGWFMEGFRMGRK